MIITSCRALGEACVQQYCYGGGKSWDVTSSGKEVVFQGPAPCTGNQLSHIHNNNNNNTISYRTNYLLLMPAVGLKARRVPRLGWATFGSSLILGTLSTTKTPYYSHPSLVICSGVVGDSRTHIAADALSGLTDRWVARQACWTRLATPPTTPTIVRATV